MAAAIGAITHDIANPLLTIKVFVDLLPRKKENPEFLDKFSRILPREVVRIEGLLGDLRQLKKMLAEADE